MEVIVINIPTNESSFTSKRVYEEATYCFSTFY